jgi:hypothetical protein
MDCLLQWSRIGIRQTDSELLRMALDTTMSMRQYLVVSSVLIET